MGRELVKERLVEHIINIDEKNSLSRVLMDALLEIERLEEVEARVYVPLTNQEYYELFGTGRIPSFEECENIVIKRYQAQIKDNV